MFLSNRLLAITKYNNITLKVKFVRTKRKTKEWSYTYIYNIHTYHVCKVCDATRRSASTQHTIGLTCYLFSTLCTLLFALPTSMTFFTHIVRKYLSYFLAWCECERDSHSNSYIYLLHVSVIYNSQCTHNRTQTHQYILQCSRCTCT